MAIGLVLTLVVVFTLNFALQCIPCYMEEKNHKYRLAFFVGLGLFFFLVAGAWIFLSTKHEFEEFFGRVMLGFLQLGLGLLFYVSKFPESKSQSCFVQLLLPSHFWWHIFIFFGGNTWVWLLFDMCRHVEEVGSSEMHELGLD